MKTKIAYFNINTPTNNNESRLAKIKEGNDYVDKLKMDEKIIEVTLEENRIKITMEDK